MKADEITRRADLFCHIMGIDGDATPGWMLALGFGPTLREMVEGFISYCVVDAIEQEKKKVQK